MSIQAETKLLDGIAIIGIVGRFPGASDVEKLWKNLCAGAESISTFSNEQLLSAGVDPCLVHSPDYVKSNFMLDGIELFDANFFGINPREAELTDPQHRVFLECAWEVLEEAGYDPDQVPLRIGVFAGVGTNSYRANVLSHPDLLRPMTNLQKWIAMDNDYVSTRVSYKLNLKGPSLTIQTACSTSLVAVHMACQSLLNFECDMALAGGASVQVPQTAGYFYQEGSNLSPDGHCRAFDENARGMVEGSGVCVVVVKRLADAVADGDYIRAVIRGSAINNDGAVKVGYTAPAVDGQASVIAEAQALAGVSADEVTYVETHGTGTTLGDPIEIAGLTKAFRRTTQRKGFCAIGAIKASVGHLGAAAGVTGLVKTVLALQNRMIPPSVNFERPNPAIDFEHSPFYVQRTLSEWQPASGRRIAGVSAFGIGGTNAHVVVEEPPPLDPSDPSRPWQLLTISAKTCVALEKATDRLAEFLASHPGLNLADVSFTLQLGRKALTNRRTLVAKDVAEAINLLKSKAPNRVRDGKPFEAEATVAFMFPAQGAQHVNMGRDLYETEPVFRENVDRCVEYLQPRLGLDLRKVLYPSDVDADEASQQLKQTRFTQPAMFIVDYALAQLWMSWGIVPAAMVGHSLGEYVAATLAEVFELKDALTLVAERGRLMQELPTGSMLAVHMSEKELQPWLRESVSLAAVNARELSVVSGPTGEIARLAEELRAAGAEIQPLRTSHAFHSAMMEPMIGPFVEMVRQVVRHTPKIPFVSTLTGTWITREDAADPGYWGKQTRHAVQFSLAVSELLKTPGRLLLEVGPGNTLSMLARLHLKESAAWSVQNSLGDFKQDREDRTCMLTALGSLWMAGVAVDWKRVHGTERRRRVSLPTYPFERKKFWIEARKVASSPFASQATSKGTEDLDEVSTEHDQAVDASTVEYALAAGSIPLYARPDLATQYEPPQTEAEKTLTKIWRDVLGVRDVGVHDNFFELGGDSLLALTLMSQVERVMGARLRAASLIAAPTIRQLAELLDVTRAQPLPSSPVHSTELTPSLSVPDA
jgi:phthiocerol/phenolphthiocerol synthesis type-I polyketide synthase E